MADYYEMKIKNRIHENFTSGIASFEDVHKKLKDGGNPYACVEFDYAKNEIIHNIVKKTYEDIILLVGKNKL